MKHFTFLISYGLLWPVVRMNTIRMKWIRFNVYYEKEDENEFAVRLVFLKNVFQKSFWNQSTCLWKLERAFSTRIQTHIHRGSCTWTVSSFYSLYERFALFILLNENDQRWQFFRESIYSVCKQDDAIHLFSS